jgi:hypothetical protein
VAWWKRDHVGVDLWLAYADVAQELGEFAAGLAAEGGEDLRDQFDQSLGRGRWRVEVPRA